MKKLLLSFLGLAAALLPAAAQVTTEPSPLKEDATNVVVYFHADQGSKGLINTPASTPLYAHTGVLTDKSTNDSDWKYAPTWNTNLDKYKLEYVSENLWKLNIGNLRDYYGVPASETITKLAFVFRNATGTKTGKATGDKDIFVPVSAAGLQIYMSSSIEGDVVTSATQDATFQVSTTIPARIVVTVNNKEIAATDNSDYLETTYHFEPLTSGGYIVKAAATAEDGSYKSVSVRYTWAEGSPTAPYPGDEIVMGPVWHGDGSATFCIGAPRKSGIYLLGSWNNYTADASSLMNTCTDANGIRYFWLTVKGLDYTTPYPYFFLVDGKTKVGDPYARLVLDPQNDKYISPEVYPNIPEYPTGHGDGAVAVFQANLNKYSWQTYNFHRPSQKDLVIYELLVRDFTGTEGAAKGNGTIRQAIDKIPYLKGLGINAVELLPINEFNGNMSWGYNPNFYFAPDKAYGTPDDYKEFIDTCHANGIAVILDMVFNQSDWQHPWYKMYNVNNNPMYNATAPHAYSVLNDWNQGHPLVRKQWVDCCRFWLKEYKVDGFRFDLVKGLGDNDSYPNNGDSGTNAFNQSRIDNMRAITEAIRAVEPDAYCINENLAGAQEENAMAEFGMLNWANVNYGGCQYAKGIQSGTNLNRFNAINDGYRKAGSTVSYLESHDEQRLAYEQERGGLNEVKNNVENAMHRLGSAAAQMIMAPGSHMIWQFSEMGNAQNTKNNTGGNNTDPKIVNWSLMEEPNHKGLVDNYSELIKFRLGHKEYFDTTNGARVILRCAESNWVNGRTISCTYNGEEIYTVVNPNVTGDPLAISVDFQKSSNSDYHVLYSSYGTTPVFDVASKTVTVPANCFAVVASKSVTGVEEVVEKAAPLSLSVARGMLTVQGAEGEIYIFTADGRMAGHLAGDGSLNLPSGLYIISTASGQSAKAVIR